MEGRTFPHARQEVLTHAGGVDSEFPRLITRWDQYSPHTAP